jgi:hypothetical protein
MDSILMILAQLGHEFFLIGGVLVALIGTALLALFLTARRALRHYRAQRFDALASTLHKQWREIVRGDVPVNEWRGDAVKCEIIQSIVIQEIGSAVGEDRAGLQEFLRTSGLIERCIQQIHDGRGWERRRRTMLALGAMRVPEAIAKPGMHGHARSGGAHH